MLSNSMDASTLLQSPSEIYSSKNIPSRLRLGKDVDLPDNVELSAIESTHSLVSPISAGSTEINWMDEKRKNMSAYEYLCHLEEAKQWLQDCLDDSLPDVVDLGDYLRNGVVLARVTQKYYPDLVKKIFESPKLQFRHSDNINYFFHFIRRMGLPEVCMFELTDLYDMKNIPKVVYSIHALGHVMQKRHMGPELKNLVGKIDFTEAELDAMQANLDEAGLKLPVFSEVGQVVENEGVHVEDRPVNEDKGMDSGAEFISPLSPPRECQDVPLPLSAIDEMESNQKVMYYQENEAKILVCQKQVRMYLERRKYLQQRNQYRSLLPSIIKLQAWTRGWLVRKKWKARQRFYQKNESVIFVIQNWFKSKLQSSAYHNLMTNPSCSIQVITKFLHLLDTNDQDSTMEVEVEQLKEKVVKQIRENTLLESDLSELDIKIALLVKNRITLDELIKVTTNKKRERGGGAGNIEKKGMEGSESDLSRASSSLFQLDRASRDRLENYQYLFYLLQTQPRYLTKLLWTMRDATHDSAKKHLETCILTLFSYAQNSREEYLILKLMENIVSTEIEQIQKLKDFINHEPSVFNLVMHYVRGAKERHYLQSTLKQSVFHILECEEELDTNYITVYKSLIKEEESTTGKKSNKKFDVSFEEAKADANTCARVKHNRILLQGFVRLVHTDILKSIGQMPYGIRYISKLLFHTLSKKFPNEPSNTLLKIVGNLIYYRYINPALVSPDAFHVTQGLITPLVRKNLTEVGKMLNVICCGKEIQPQTEVDSEYKETMTRSFFEFLYHVIKVPEPEIQLNYDEFTDITRTRNPVIYISLNEIFLMHETLLKYKEAVCGDSPDDPLNKLLETMGASSPVMAQDTNGPEMALTLTPARVATNLQEDYELRHLFYMTKKESIKLIRVSKNEKSFLDVLDSPNTRSEEDLYVGHKSTNIPLYTSMYTLRSSYSAGDQTLKELKEQLKSRLDRLESAGMVTRKDGYQALLNSIVTDMRTKHVRRDLLRNEKVNLETTLKTLREKYAFLKDQEKSYLEYVEACQVQLASHSAHHPSKKKRPFFAFSKQARHIRDVEKKTGVVPKFGSYIYTAKEFLEKGIVAWVDPERVPNAFLDKLNITVSSNTAGVFEVEASFGLQSGIKALDSKHIIQEQDSFKLDELLSLQFENKPELALFDNTVKVNVNLMIFFINKKFYA